MSIHYSEIEQRTVPPIVLSESDRDRLFDLARAALARAPDVAGALLDEVDRAAVVSTQDLPPNTVAMLSHVTFRDETGDERTVQIVYPQDADIAKGRISILTPIGAALIGLSEGQSMRWRTRDGRLRRLTIVEVRSSPAMAGA